MRVEVQRDTVAHALVLSHLIWLDHWELVYTVLDRLGMGKIHMRCNHQDLSLLALPERRFVGPEESDGEGAHEVTSLAHLDLRKANGQAMRRPDWEPQVSRIRLGSEALAVALKELQSDNKFPYIHL